MRKKLRILSAGLFLVVLVVVAWKPLRLGEPWYHWRPLSGWLEVYGAGPGRYKPSPKADEALRHIGPKAVPYLLRLLQAKDPPASTNAFMSTTAFSPALMPAATNVSVKVRLMMWVEKHTPIRFYRTKAPASWEHWKAYLGFQALGPLGEAAIPDLVEMAHDPSDNSNPSGTGMAPNIGFWKDTVVVAMYANQSATYLAPGQSPLNGRVRRNAILVDGEIAAWSLAAIGAESVPPLMELLADPNPRLRCRAAVALGLIGGAAEPAVPALIKMLNDRDINARWEAADALGCIGQRPDLAVPALTHALTDRDVGMKFSAMKSLGEFQERASNAIPALLALFPDGDMRIGQSAASALIRISRDTTEKEVLPFLLRRLKDSQHPYVRHEALRTISEARYEPQIVIPTLIEATADSNTMVRSVAIYLLGEFGPQAKAAVPKLVSLTTDPDGNLRTNAILALEKIDPDRQASAKK